MVTLSLFCCESRLRPVHLQVVVLDELRPEWMGIADFLFAAWWLMADAPLVMGSSGSNMGRFLFWLAAARQRRVPAVTDMEFARLGWNSSAMANGYFFCKPHLASGGMCNQPCTWEP